MAKDVLAERADSLFSVYQDLKAGRIEQDAVEHRVSDALTLRQEEEQPDSPERIKQIKDAIGSALSILRDKVYNPAVTSILKPAWAKTKAGGRKAKEISKSMYEAAKEKMKDWRLRRLAYNLIEHLRLAKNNDKLAKLDSNNRLIKKLDETKKANLDTLYDKYLNNLITEGEMPSYVVLIVAGESPDFPTEDEDEEPLVDPTRGRYYYIWWLFEPKDFKTIQAAHRFPCRRPGESIDVEEIERKFIGSADATDFNKGEYFGRFLYGRGQVPFKKEFTSPVPIKSLPTNLLEKVKQEELIIGLGVALDTSSEFKHNFWGNLKRVSSKGKGELNYDSERISYWKWAKWDGGVTVGNNGTIKGRVVDKARATAAHHQINPATAGS